MKYFNWVPLLSPLKREKVTEVKGKRKLDIRKEGKVQFLSYLKEFENFINTKDISKIKSKAVRQVKKLRVFKLDKVDGRIVKQHKVTNMVGFKQHLQINKTNRIVSITPNYVGFRPSYPINFNNVIVSVINEKFNYIKDEFPRVFNNIKESLVNFREVFSGAYDSNSGHIIEFMKDDTTKFLAEEIITECKDSPWLKSPHLDLTSIDDLPYITNFNPNSHCGHYSMRFFNFRMKGATIQPAILLAQRKFELIKKYAIKNFTLWDVFAREKDMKVDSDSSTMYKTRLVLSTEHYQTLLLSYFFQKLMVSVESFSNTKFHLKGEYDGTKSFELLRKSQKYDYVIDADWPKFDSSIDSEYLLAAGAIMFSNCLTTRESFRIIFHLISSFITKYVVLPPGIVIELNRGNPSGHPGVTAINCYVNLFRWIQIGRKIYGKNYWKYMDIEVYGDDAYVFFKNHSNLHRVDNFIDELGFAKIDVYDRLFPTTLLLTDNESAPDFLKRKISLNGLRWNTTKVIDKLIYQSKKRSILEQVELIKSFVTTAPGDPQFNDFLIFLVKEIEHDYLKAETGAVESINLFLKNVKRFELCDKSYFRDYYKQLNVLKQTQSIYLKRFEGLDHIKNYNWFNINTLKAYFLICENGVFTKYIRSVWKNEKVRQRLAFDEFEYNALNFDNEKRALDDFWFKKLKGTK